MTVVFREQAIADLDEIARYIGQRNPAAASQVIRRINRVIHKTIRTFPFSGRLNAANNTREYAVPGLPYLIIYLPGAADEWYHLNTRAILRDREGRWFRPTRVWQQLVNPLVARAMASADSGR